MPTPVVLPSFAAGELSPSLHGRVDLAKYHVGLATCKNWYILAEGGATTRPGTMIVGEIKDSDVLNRQYGFQFSQVQSYILDFGDQNLRFIKDGGYILEAAVVITGITNANPGVVSAASHGFSNGDHVWIVDAEGMTEVNLRRFTVANAATNTFELSGVDTSSYGTWTAGGTVARLYTISTPYVEADLPLLKFVQSADTLTITHPDYEPRNLTRTGHTSWTLSVITFAPAQAAPTGLTSTSPGSGFDYVVTAVNDETGEESRASVGTSATTQTSTLTWTDAAGASTYNVYKAKNSIYGFIGRAGSGAVGFTDATIDPNTSTGGVPAATNPFNGSGNWPGCSQYHDGRQWFARTDTKPQTLFGSQSANFNNFDVSTPTEDSDAITRTIASRQVDEIRFMVSFNSLLVLTSGAIWKAWPGSQGDVMTPANTNVRLQAYEGTANVEPIVTADAVLYVTASAKRVREAAYNIGSDSYQGPDRSVLAKHLFRRHTIVMSAYARDPDGIVWYLREDGVLLGFTYLREHDVYAWSRHITDGTIESVATVVENNESALYLQVARNIGGTTKRFVERMSTRVFETVYDSWCLDSAYQYDGWNTDTERFLKISAVSYGAGSAVTMTATGFTPFSADSVGDKYILRSGQNQVTVTVTAFDSSSQVEALLDMAAAEVLQNNRTADWALATTTLYGLWHLEGETVTVFADGGVASTTAVVANGKLSGLTAAGRILAGLPYECDLETLNIEAGQPTLQGRQKRVSEVVLRVQNTRGLQVGPTEDRLTPIKERSTEVWGYPTQLTTGDERIVIDPAWGSNGRVFIRQSEPLPATVVAIIPKIDSGA